MHGSGQGWVWKRNGSRKRMITRDPGVPGPRVYQKSRHTLDPHMSDREYTQQVRAQPKNSSGARTVCRGNNSHKWMTTQDPDMTGERIHPMHGNARDQNLLESWV